MIPALELAQYAREDQGIFYFDSVHGTKTLVLVHGNGDEADTWRHIFVPLAAHFRVIALDLPGFGRSRSQTSTIQGFSKTLLGLLDTLAFKSVHLVGSSLGAVVAATFASQQPTRVAGLCLIGGAAPNLGRLEPSVAVQSLLEPEVGEAFYNGLRQAGQDAAFESLRPYYADLNAMPAADLAFLHTRVWERVRSDTQRDTFFAALRSLFAPAEPLKLNLPTHLIWGEADQIVPQHHALRLLEQIPNSHLSMIAKAGHLPHQEQPQATLRAILELV